jgi:ABC-type molybdate transport system substrate-binding protein
LPLLEASKYTNGSDVKKGLVDGTSVTLTVPEDFTVNDWNTHPFFPSLSPAPSDDPDVYYVVTITANADSNGTAIDLSPFLLTGQLVSPPEKNTDKALEHTRYMISLQPGGDPSGRDNGK